MAAFQDVRLGYENEVVNEQKMVLLFDLQQSKKFSSPHWKYKKFKLA